MRLAWLFVVIFVAGCGATQPALAPEYVQTPFELGQTDAPLEREYRPLSIDRDESDDPLRDLELRRVSASEESSTLVLRNVSRNRVVQYYHWMTQGPEPVAYCLKSDGSTWICSEKIFATGDESTGYSPLIHDTVMFPGESVMFRIRAGAEVKVGIEVVPSSLKREDMLWVKD
jgi:hypothetical protein